MEQGEAAVAEDGNQDIVSQKAIIGQLPLVIEGNRLGHDFDSLFFDVEVVIGDRVGEEEKRHAPVEAEEIAAAVFSIFKITFTELNGKLVIAVDNLGGKGWLFV